MRQHRKLAWDAQLASLAYIGGTVTVLKRGVILIEYDNNNRALWQRLGRQHWQCVKCVLGRIYITNYKGVK